jgi:hypothetical protein
MGDAWLNLEPGNLSLARGRGLRHSGRRAETDGGSIGAVKGEQMPSLKDKTVLIIGRFPERVRPWA